MYSINNVFLYAPFTAHTIFILIPDTNSLSRIAKGARRATVVATATVVAGIKQNGDATAEPLREDNGRLSSSLNLASTGTKCNDSLTPGIHYFINRQNCIIKQCEGAYF